MLFPTLCWYNGTMKELCASILAANHAHLARDLKEAEKSGISRFHIDVADGHYTPNLIFGDQLVRDLRSETASYLDVHLAAFDLPEIAAPFLDSGANGITIQYETCALPQRLLVLIRQQGLDTALSFIPATGFDRIEYFMDEVDVISLLAVDPGIGGQTFNPKIFKKLEQAAAYRENHRLPTRIAVDGGLNRENIRALVDAGADILILGSGIFRGNIGQNVQALAELISGRA